MQIGDLKEAVSLFIFDTRNSQAVSWFIFDTFFAVPFTGLAIYASQFDFLPILFFSYQTWLMSDICKLHLAFSFFKRYNFKCNDMHATLQKRIFIAVDCCYFLMI